MKTHEQSLLVRVFFEMFFPKIAQEMQELRYEVEKLEKDRDRCKAELSFRIKEDNTLKVWGNVRGCRYDKVILPKWYQTKDYSELGKDFAFYVESEALSTRRIKWK